jgi:hypothetical protein
LKPTTKQARQDKRLAELLGIDPEEVASLRSKSNSDDIMREAQAVFLFIEKPEAFISKKCDQCHRAFLTTYQFVSVCSTDCRIKSLEKIGIDWNPLHTPEERWKRSKIPTEYSIPPKALRILLQMAQEQQSNEVQIGPYQSVGMYPLPDEITSEPPVTTENTPQSNNGAQESQPVKPPVPEFSESEELLKEFGLDLSL